MWHDACSVGKTSMRLEHLLSPPCLAALVLVGAIGCTTSLGTESDGAGGHGLEPSGTGTGGAGGEHDALPVCDCSLALRGCGSELATAAADSGCVIAVLPEGADDLLACSDGEWRVEEPCANGCEAGAADTPAGCVVGLPTIRMDNLVVQAQVEPFRGNQPSLPGDFAVEQVQTALGEEGFAVTIDGWFGNATATSYAGWQAQLGYSGLGANGIPGPTSLAMLGANRFEIQHEIVVGAHTTHSGRTVNQRTHDMLVKAEAIVGHPIVVTQGSYNAGGVSASAGTHDGGGAVDVSVLNITTTHRWQMVEALRTVGFAAWLRTPSQGNWPYHIHAIAIGDTDVSVSARNQVADYYVGLNGLASHAADNTPAAYQVPFTWWEKYQGN